MLMTGNCVLKPEHLLPSNLHFPGKKYPVELHAPEQVSEAHHSLPFLLLRNAVLKPVSEDETEPFTCLDIQFLVACLAW